jgi:hypothetical protein
MPHEKANRQKKYLEYILKELYCSSYGVDPEDMSAKYVREEM